MGRARRCLFRRKALQQDLSPRRDSAGEAATKTEQPIQNASDATGSMDRSQQADTGKERHAKPLQQTQSTRSQAD
ncbi:hypothetical protein EMIT0P291_30080 [Pseudomonas sp. IT-P291]